MTHAEQIMRAICRLTRRGISPFTRMNVRDELGLDAESWLYGYTAIFQGMRADQPGGAPEVPVQFRGVTRRVGHGQYVLTDVGRALCT